MSDPASVAPIQPITIALTATFTAEPVEKALSFWMQELEVPVRLVFAPYNQVFQELLDPFGLLAQNPGGINVVLVRLEDWQREEPGEQGNAAQAPFPYQKIERNVSDLVRAVREAVARSAAIHLLCLCPGSPVASANPERAAFFHRMEARITSELGEVPGVHVVTRAELTAAYPVADFYDSQADKLAHAPYTPVFSSVLGTMVARKFHALQNVQYKMIVLDADNTLWGGMCGEDGPLGIRIDAKWQAVQAFLVQQHDQGMLLCLCSKNNEEDVAEVFARRPEMVLQRQHFAAWRINWKAKSENIQSLAQELRLGLDGVIYIDDNPVECAEVQANRPEVLTLLLPREPGRLAAFVRNVWALDRLKVTAEGRERTSLYRQNFERQRVQEESLTLQDFLAGLDLKVRISALEKQQLARVAELTQRANQFNLTTIPRSEAELPRQCQEAGAECLTVHAQDRFGDYGLVGVIIFQVGPTALSVDTFLLSCRALGKGVEHRMLARLGEIGRQRGLSWIDVPYIRTPKNQPALVFLEGVGANFRETRDNGFLFRFPADVAAALRDHPPRAERTRGLADLPSPSSTRTAAHSSADMRAQATLLQMIAADFSDPEKIHQAVMAHARKRPELPTNYVAPRTPGEEKVADIFCALLGIDRVGIHDIFFSLGGDSLLATQAMARIGETFQVELSPLLFFMVEFTVAELAKAAMVQQVQQADPHQIAALLRQFEELSDDEVRMLLAGQESSVPEQKSG